MQSFFRANPNNNQQPMQGEMPMREPIYEQNMPSSRANMPDRNDMTDRNDMQERTDMPGRTEIQNSDTWQREEPVRHQSETPPQRSVSPQSTRPLNHGFVAPSGNDNYFENSVAYQGAMQQILAENTGEYVSVEFLIGTSQTVERRGILYAVGVSYIVLYNPEDDTYIVCDLFAIKFVTFYNSTER